MRNDRTWCVGLAKPIPVWTNLGRIATPLSWWLAVATVYLEGVVLYWIIKHETGQAGFMRKDFHYCVFMMAMSYFTGMSNVTYKPRSNRMKLVIGLMMTTGILISTAWNAFLIKVLTNPIYKPQVSTIAEIIEKDFDLIGLYRGRELMLQQPSKVNSLADSISEIIFHNFFFVPSYQVSRGQKVHWLSGHRRMFGTIEMERQHCRFCSPFDRSEQSVDPEEWNVLFFWTRERLQLQSGDSNNEEARVPATNQRYYRTMLRVWTHTEVAQRSHAVCERCDSGKRSASHSNIWTYRWSDFCSDLRPVRCVTHIYCRMRCLWQD